MAMRFARVRGATSATGRLLFELIVIFLGVYLAFWVENYRENQQERERAREIASVLDRDLADVIRVEESLVNEVRSGIEQWKSARLRGETPVPFHLRLPGSEKPPTTNFELIVQSRPVELFDAEFVFDLGFYYSELSGVGDRYVRYAEFTESQILPSAIAGESVFYNDEATALLPIYAAHMERLEELAGFWEDDIARARELRDRLAQYLE